MRRILAVCLLVLMAVPAFAENYLLNGGQASQINYQMVQKVQLLSNTRKLIPELSDFLRRYVLRS